MTHLVLPVQQVHDEGSGGVTTEKLICLHDIRFLKANGLEWPNRVRNMQGKKGPANGHANVAFGLGPHGVRPLLFWAVSFSPSSRPRWENKLDDLYTYPAMLKYGQLVV